jgi:hypothetical protein
MALTIAVAGCISILSHVLRMDVICCEYGGVNHRCACASTRATIPYHFAISLNPALDIHGDLPLINRSSGSQTMYCLQRRPEDGGSGRGDRRGGEGW